MTNAYMQEFIVANERCIYLQAFIFANDSYRYIFIFANSSANMHGPMQVWKPRAYLLPLSKGTPAQRIRKTAFLKHPRRFGLQFSINIPVSKFFSPIYICVRLRRVLMPSYYVCILCVFAPSFWTFFKAKKIWGQHMIGSRYAANGKAAHFILFMRGVFFVPKLASKSQFPLVVKNNLRCQTRKKKAPWYTSRWSNFLAFKFKSSFFGQYILSSRPLGGNMMWKSSNPALFLRNYWWWT